jgi:hypothetical protein
LTDPFSAPRIIRDVFLGEISVMLVWCCVHKLNRLSALSPIDIVYLNLNYAVMIFVTKVG